MIMLNDGKVFVRNINIYLVNEILSHLSINLDIYIFIIIHFFIF